MSENEYQPLHVAVVDDDERFCRSLARLLRAAGMQSMTYISGEEFLADPTRARFDCLVLDIHLGGMSGLELGRRLVAEGRPPPFIYVTAHDDPEVRAGAEAAGCAAFFRKTDRGVKVLDAIRRAALEHDVKARLFAFSKGYPRCVTRQSACWLSVFSRLSRSPLRRRTRRSTSRLAAV